MIATQRIDSAARGQCSYWGILIQPLLSLCTPRRIIGDEARALFLDSVYKNDRHIISHNRILLIVRLVLVTSVSQCM